MKGVWLLCIIGIAVVLLIAYNGKCGSTLTEGLRGGGGRGGGGGGRGGGGGGRGGGGGGRGGGGIGGGGGGRGGGGIGGGGRGGGGHGGHGGHRGHRGHGGHGHGGSWWGTGYWPGWWSWYSDPYYYIDLPYLYDIDEDPCNCFNKYKTAIDSGVPRAIAAKNLETCVQSTLSGGPCL